MVTTKVWEVFYLVVLFWYSQCRLQVYIRKNNAFKKSKTFHHDYVNSNTILRGKDAAQVPSTFSIMKYMIRGTR